MATTYNLEPSPTAKVLLKTTTGDILLEVFASHTPLTSRNFLQLCVDGYYDNTIFHRLVPGFIVQGGDPTGTGHGGEAIYNGGLFADEFHSRLRFNRRGLLGMANGGTKDDNGSQFFLTLGDTKELTGKNTMFGRVAAGEGNTLYNLMKMNDLDLEDVEGSDRPMYAPKIIGTEVLVNPFEDMKKREVKVSTAGMEEKKKVVKKKKPKGKNVLSFVDDEEMGDAPPAVLKKKKFNTALVADIPKDDHRPSPPPVKARQAKSPLRVPVTVQDDEDTPPPVAKSKTKKPVAEPTHHDSSDSDSDSDSDAPPENERLNKTNAKIAEIKASLKRSHDPTPVETSKSKMKSLLSIQKSMLPPTSIPARKRKKGNVPIDSAYEDSILSAMSAFKSKLASVSSTTTDPSPDSMDVDDVEGPTEAPDADHEIESAGIDPDADEQTVCDLHFIPNCKSCSWHETTETAAAAAEEDDNDVGWLNHKLSFAKDRLGKDLEWKRRNDEELVVIDPREKTKELMEEERRKKEGRRGGNTKAFRPDGYKDKERKRNDQDRERRRAE